MLQHQRQSEGAEGGQEVLLAVRVVELEDDFPLKFDEFVPLVRENQTKAKLLVRYMAEAATILAEGDRPPTVRDSRYRASSRCAETRDGHLGGTEIPERCVNASGRERHLGL